LFRWAFVVWGATELLPLSPVCFVTPQSGLYRLKVYGAGEWQREKQGGRGRRTWRKLHLAVNPNSSEILASELTTNEIGDSSMVRPLLDQIPGTIASVTADGAYDGEPCIGPFPNGSRRRLQRSSFHRE
jgi:hypothetical protein